MKKIDFQNECATRRARVCAEIGTDAVLVLYAGTQTVRSRDVHYPFCADKDFFYFTDCNHPDIVLVLAPGSDHGASFVFCAPFDASTAVWEGEGVHAHNARAVIGTDNAFAFDDFARIMTPLLTGRRVLYAKTDKRGRLFSLLADCVGDVYTQTRTASKLTAIERVESLVHPMRTIKTKPEIARIQQAVDISVQAHQAAMCTARTARYEYEIAAAFVQSCNRVGAVHQAYPPIAASGANACTLHYTNNTAAFAKTDMVLLDAGCEYDGYAADITCTYPVSGAFSAEQAALYRVVLDAQRAAIACVRPGASFADLESTAVAVLTEGLCDLGLLQGSVSDNIAEKQYTRFYMHRIGHWLGLDVHDVGAYTWKDDMPICFQPNMVFTIEPGLYVHPAHHDADNPFLGLGIRIEDDVCVTEDGAVVLSAALPRVPSAITEFMNGA